MLARLGHQGVRAPPVGDRRYAEQAAQQETGVVDRIADDHVRAPVAGQGEAVVEDGVDPAQPAQRDLFPDRVPASAVQPRLVGADRRGPGPAFQLRALPAGPGGGQAGHLGDGQHVRLPGGEHLVAADAQRPQLRHGDHEMGGGEADGQYSHGWRLSGRSFSRR